MNVPCYDSDKLFINAGNVFAFCNTNLELLTARPRGLVLEFPGLGGGSCLGGSLEPGPYTGDYARALAAQGLLLAYVFPGPWSWMNTGAVRICDLVVDALAERCGLPPGFPLVATGGSMGGLGGLVYAADTRHRLTACAVTCPCIDARAAMGAHPSFPRTIISAVAACDAPFEAALASISPAARLDDMPAIEYLVMADCEDELFPVKTLDDYVEQLRAVGANVEYIRMEGCTHGGFTDAARRWFTEFIIEKAAGACGHGVD